MNGIKCYSYLVERRSDGKRFVMNGNLKECNIGSGRYLYDFANRDYEYSRLTHYGHIMNISTGKKYNSKRYRIIYQIAVNPKSFL